MNTEIWLIRHGEPAADARGRCYGSLDVELSEDGKKAMERVAARLANEHFTAIYTSPRRRCDESARLIAALQSCAVHAVEELAEIDFGEFEGRIYEEIAASHPEIYGQWMTRPTEVHFPGGESFTMMWDRVTAAAQIIRERHAGQSIALVTHAGVIRILIAQALSIPRENIFRLGQGYGAVNLVRYQGDYPILERLNCVLHETLDERRCGGV